MLLKGLHLYRLWHCLVMTSFYNNVAQNDIILKITPLINKLAGHLIILKLPKRFLNPLQPMSFNEYVGSKWASKGSNSTYNVYVFTWLNPESKPIEILESSGMMKWFRYGQGNCRFWSIHWVLHPLSHRSPGWQDKRLQAGFLDSPTACDPGLFEWHYWPILSNPFKFINT